MTARDDMIATQASVAAIGEQREQCEQHFMTTGAYWKSVVLGIVALIGLSAGIFAWGMRVTGVESAHAERIRENKEHIIVIEKSLNGKLDKILRAVEGR